MRIIYNFIIEQAAKGGIVLKERGIDGLMDVAKGLGLPWTVLRGWPNVNIIMNAQQVINAEYNPSSAESQKVRLNVIGVMGAQFQGERNNTPGINENSLFHSLDILVNYSGVSRNTVRDFLDNWAKMCDIGNKYVNFATNDAYKPILGNIEEMIASLSDTMANNTTCRRHENRSKLRDQLHLL